MKKYTVLFAILLIAAILAGTLSGCSVGNRKLIGTWVEIEDDGDEGDVITFARNGKGTLEEDGLSADLTWSTKGKILTITVSMCGMSETNEYRYSISGKKMTWVDVNDKDDVMKFRKRK